MKQKLLFAIFALSLLAHNVHAQNGYIYIHDKTLNEQAAGQFNFTLTGPSSYSKSFILDNSPAFIIGGDLGASHTASGGTNADGELWAVGNSTATVATDAADITGAIYHRAAGSSQWTALTVNPITTSTVSAIDGAYYNQCVFVRGTSVYFYNGTTATVIYTAATGSVLDVTAGGGKVAIVLSSNHILVDAGAYTAAGIGSLGTTTGGWTDISTTTTTRQASRLDMNVGGTSIVYMSSSSTAKVYTMTIAGGTVTNVATLSGAPSQPGNPDVAFDDKGFMYAVGASADPFDEVWSNNSGSWAVEPQSGYVDRLTGGAGGQAWGMMSNGDPNTIFTRTTDGTATWFDDERIRTATVGTSFANNTGTTSGGAANGNSIMIPVVPGTYTLTQTLPDATWDLGRYKTYVPSTSSLTTDVASRTAIITVAANNVVHIEFINEKLNPTAIELICANQTLQTFGTDASTNHNVTYGAPVQGTVYHYWNQTSPHDGDYYVVKNLTNWFNPTPNLTDHGGNANGYFLLVNASYTKDEFYRQRVTNLVPGLSYIITFYAANVSSGDPIKPNVLYGLQDLDGVVITSSSTGNITAGSVWQLYSFTFTATASTADLFLTNNNIGGQGNDLAIDDIALNPVITPLPDIEVSPKIFPNICIGTQYTFFNNQAGGIWTTSNGVIASIGPKTGVASGLVPGTAVFTYTYTNQVGCVSAKTTGIIVSAPPSAISISDKYGKVVCSGQADSLFSTATGGTAPYTYSWSASPSFGDGLSAADSVKQNARITPVTGNNSYLFTSLVTDVVGCSISDTMRINTSSHTAPTLSLNNPANVCLGSSITLTATKSGGTAPFNYYWSGTAPTTNGVDTSIHISPITITPTGAGSYVYTLKITDQFCTEFASTTGTTIYPKPAVTVSGPSGLQELCGSNGAIALTSNLTAAGTTPDTYAWVGAWVSGPTTGGNANLQSPTNTTSVSSRPDLTGTSSGNPDVYKYTLTVTDAHSCTATDNVSVSMYKGSSSNFTASASSTPSAPVTVCSGTNIALTASYSGGSLLGTKSYAWTGPGGYTSTGTPTSAAATSSGNYVVTITDGGALGTGCSASAATGLFTVKPTPVVTASVFASGLCNTNIIDTAYALASGGSGSGYSYAWSTLTKPSGATVTISSPSNDTTALKNFSKTGAYTFLVTVTDAGNSCTATDITPTITYSNVVGPAITGMAAASNSCVGSTFSFTPTVTTGTVTTDLVGSGTASASSTSGTHSASNAFDGTTTTSNYWESSNNNGEYVSYDFGSSKTINQIQYYPHTGNEINMSNARFDVSNSASFSSYTTIYTISGTPTSGSYTTVTPTTIASGRYVRLYFQSHRGFVTDIDFFNITSTAVSSYAWTASPTGNGLGATATQNTTATPDTAGSYTYTLKVTDANNCAIAASTGVQKVFDSLSVNAQSSNPGFCGTSGVIQLFSVVSGGSGTYSSYAWTYTRNSGTGTSVINSATDENPSVSLTNTSLGSKFTYNVIVTDSVGCTAHDSTNTIVVANTPVVNASAAAANTKCVGQTINLLGVVSTPTKAPYVFSWTPPTNSTVTPVSTTTSLTTNSATATALAAGNFAYGLLLLDSNNCTATANTSPVIAITDTPKVAVALGTLPATICHNPTSSINLTGSVTTGTTSPYTYSWAGTGIVNANSLTTTAVPDSTRQYQFTATDLLGCIGSAYSAQVVVDQATPSISFTCHTGGGEHGDANYIILSESVGNTWLWTTAHNSRFYTGPALSVSTDSVQSTLATTYVSFRDIYSVRIADVHNCIGNGSVTIDSTSCGTSIILPITLIDFTAQKQNSTGLLKWTTSTEINNDRFVIERSSDGATWQTIGTVPGHGNSSTVQYYSFTDATPLNGINYYRLKQVDVNGRFGYSAVRSLQFTAQWLVHLYPNPASDFIVLEFNNDKDEKAHISIQTVLGSTIFVTEQALSKGLNRILLNQVQPLAQGTYIVTLATETNIFRSKFVKGNK